MTEPRKTPCYAVIFTSKQSENQQGYAAMAQRMATLAAQQPGYLSMESTRSPDGTGITVSYWRDLATIKAWRENAEHKTAQQLGKQKWYTSYSIEIARIEAVYRFPAD